MATPKFNESAYQSAIKERDALQKELQSSSSAFSDVTNSSDVSKDIAYQAALKKVSTMESLKQKESWYGTTTGDSTTQGQPKAGLFSRLVSGLGAPTRFIVGGAESLLGLNDKGVLDSAKYNMTTGNKYSGDLLQETGMPKWLSSGIGFGIDMAIDPINWASAGTTALLPKMGAGMVKGVAKEGVIGGLKGLKSAAVSSIGGDALAVSKFIPGVKGSKIFEKAAGAVGKNTEEWMGLTGIDQLNIAGRGMFGTDAREGGFTIAAGLESAIRKIPNGDKFITAFKYSPADWGKKAKIIDTSIKLIEDQTGMVAKDLDIQKLVRELDSPTMKVKTYSSHIDQASDELASFLDDSEYIANKGTRDSVFMADGAEEIMSRLAEEAGKDTELLESLRYMAKLNSDKTGIDIYDRMAKAANEKISSLKVGDVEVGKKFLTTVQGLDSLFKFSKITGSISSHVNAFASNLVFPHLYGLDISDTFLGDKGAGLIATYRFLEGKDAPAFVIKNFTDEMSDFSKMVSMHPTELSATYGLKSSLFSGRDYVSQMVKEGKLQGLITDKASEVEFVRRLTKEVPDEIRQMTEDFAVGKTTAGGFSEAVSKANPAILGKQRTLSEGLSSLDVNEITGQGRSLISSDPSYYELKNYWAKRAKEGDPVYKVLDTVMNKTIGKFQNHFERIDQSAKIVTALKMTNRGITEKELKAVSRNIKGGITPDDITDQKIVDGVMKYFISWDKATDIVNDIYMNYAAMPAFVRMMRTIPIVGMPFGAFTYGATSKLIKNTMANPQMINKFEFFKQEMQGEKSPIEKEALKTPYYGYYNSPGMVKLPFNIPFFGDKPAYLNINNWVPYYSLNIFSPTERKYSDTNMGNLASMADKIGLFGTPTGQVLWNYFLQGMFTEKGEILQNKFGTALTPTNATGIEKVGYAARDLAEAYTPNVLAPLGMIAGSVAPGLNQALPSYQMRKFAEGVGKKNAQGIIQPNKDVAQIQLENLGSYAGISAKPLDLTTLTNTIKKSNK